MHASRKHGEISYKNIWQKFNLDQCPVVLLTKNMKVKAVCINYELLCADQRIAHVE